MTYAQVITAPALPNNPPIATQDTGQPTTEYTWPNSSQDVDMTSGDEPIHTTLFPPKETGKVLPLATPAVPPHDRNIAQHLAVQKALTSLALNWSMEQDRDDILAGISLPIISEPLLPSLIPINEEESLLFSHIRPLQGAALVKAAGITEDDVPAVGTNRPKPRWSIPVIAQTTDDDTPMTTQEPTYNIASDSETYEDVPLSQGLKKMQSAFPDMSEEHLTIALQKHNNDLPSVMAWMQSAVDMREMRATLLLAFPTADTEDIEGAVKEFKGDFMLAFNRLAASHDPTDDWSNMTFMRRRGVMDIGDEAPEFLYDDSATRSFENQWWRTCVSVRRHRISAYPHIDAIWTKLSQVAVAPRPITPRFMKYIEDLGKKHLDQPSFWKAIRTLRAQWEYDGIVAVIGEPKHQFVNDKDKHPAIPILQVLLTDGLISPAAAGWLALAIYLDNILYKNYIPCSSASLQSGGKSGMIGTYTWQPARTQKRMRVKEAATQPPASARKKCGKHMPALPWEP